MRLLTIHAAKGLEFKVVIVADAGRDRAGRRRRTRSSRSPTAASASGWCIRRAATRGRVRLRARCARRGREEERAERLRLYYVAMTRAIDRLIVSGAIDPSERRRDDADRLGARAARARESSPTAGGDAGRARARRGAVPRARRPLAPRAVDEPSPATPMTSPTSWPARALRRAARRAGARRARAAASSSRCRRRRSHDVRRLSYSALALFERCSYRYYAERVAGLRARRGNAAATASERRPRGDRDRRRRAPAARARRPRDPRRLAERARGVVRDVVPGRRPRRSSSGSAVSSPRTAVGARRRVAALDGARPERPFAFEHDGVLLHGRLDVL